MGNMGESLDLARKLALRDYDIIVTRDTLSDGMVMYCAKSPELNGCIAQGRTVIEATKNLIDARVDYIYSLLLDMLPVPDPNSHKTGGEAGVFLLRIVWRGHNARCHHSGWMARFDKASYSDRAYQAHIHRRFQHATRTVCVGGWGEV